MLKVNQLGGFAGGGYDASAVAFFAAAGITDNTQKRAVNQLVKDLKKYGIWSNCLAIYPFVGGTSTTHSYNLKNTAAFQISWSGTVTHDSNGITPNGTTGYGNTGLNGSTQSLNDNSHLSVYVRTDTAAGDKTEINAYDGASAYWSIKVRQTGDETFHGLYRFTTDGIITAANTDARGFYLNSRRGAADGEAYKNGASTGTCGDSTQNIPNASVHIGKRSDTGTSYTDRNIAFASIGYGLTDQQSSDFYTSVQAFQTALSRNI